MTSSETSMPDSARGIGERLKQARIRAGLSPSEVAAKLKMPTHVIEALEREDWAHIGAPVFIRGHLRSYARLMELPGDVMVENIPAPASSPVELVPRTFTPRMQRMLEQTARRLVYVVITATIAVPVWLATRSHLDGAVAAVSLDVESISASEQPQGSPAVGSQPASNAALPAPPLVASIAPPLPRPAAAADITVSFSGESWIKLTAPDGTMVEQALVQPGQQRVLPAGQIGKAVLGNAQAVSARYRGQPLDLTPYIRANVVRFTVSSDGSLQPVGR